MAQYKTKQGISKSFNTCKWSGVAHQHEYRGAIGAGGAPQQQHGLCRGCSVARDRQAGVEHWGRRAHKKHTSIHSPRAITYSTTEQRGAVRHSCTGDSKPGAVTRQAPAQ